MDDLISQLIWFYFKFEDWHETRLSEAEIQSYFKTALKKDLIITEMYGSELLGYCEAWRVSHETLGKILCRVPIDIAKEDLRHGPVAFVNSVVVHPDHRNTGVFTSLKHKFFKKHFMSTHFIGERRHKSSPVKIYTRQEFMDKYVTFTEKELSHGKQ